jgi:hypothetical protein
LGLAAEPDPIILDLAAKSHQFISSLLYEKKLNKKKEKKS